MLFYAILIDEQHILKAIMWAESIRILLACKKAIAEIAVS